MLMKPHEEIFKCFNLILVEIDEMSEYMHEIVIITCAIMKLMITMFNIIFSIMIRDIM